MNGLPAIDPRRDALRPGALLAVLGGLLVALVAISTAPGVMPSVVAPLVALVLTTTGLVTVLWQRRRGLVPWFEIGVVYAGIVTLYGVYPLLRFFVIGEHYVAPELDVRWTNLDPSTEEVAYVGWLYACHLVAFTVAYVLVRGRVAFAPPRLQPPRLSSFIAVTAIYVVVQGFWIFLGLFYDTAAESYVESYLVSQRLPLVLAQLLNHLSGAKYPLSLVILAGLFARYPASRPYIAGWIGVMAVITVGRLGSRTELALLLLATGMMYSALVRPVPPALVGLGVGAGVGGFILLGMLRGGASLDGAATLNPFLHASEFDVLFGNAVELARRSADGTIGVVPPALYFFDVAALVPQQLAPFVKVDPAAWYVNRFYPEYAALGGGLAFGTMAEAAMTGGLVSAVVRGAALGFVFAKIHRLYVRRGDRYWVLVFYVWATTLSYQAFRGTTFMLLVLFTFRFLPVVIGVRLLAAALRRAASQTREWLQVEPAR